MELMRTVLTNFSASVDSLIEIDDVRGRATGLKEAISSLVLLLHSFRTILKVSNRVSGVS